MDDNTVSTHAPTPRTHPAHGERPVSETDMDHLRLHESHLRLLVHGTKRQREAIIANATHSIMKMIQTLAKVALEGKKIPIPMDHISDMRKLTSSNPAHHEEKKKILLKGGGFWKTFKKVGSTVLTVAKTAAKFMPLLALLL